LISVSSLVCDNSFANYSFSNAPRQVRQDLILVSMEEEKTIRFFQNVVPKGCYKLRLVSRMPINDQK